MHIKQQAASGGERIRQRSKLALGILARRFQLGNLSLILVGHRIKNKTIGSPIKWHE